MPGHPQAGDAAFEVVVSKTWGPGPEKLASLRQRQVFESIDYTSTWSPKALRTQKRAPASITLDGYAASHRAVREMPREGDAWKHTKLRSSKYLNNLIEQDHRGIKSRTGPMLGFKNF